MAFKVGSHTAMACMHFREVRSNGWVDDHGTSSGTRTWIVSKNAVIRKGSNLNFRGGFTWPLFGIAFGDEQNGTSADLVLDGCEK